jgi:Uma2 family endonuclease
MTQQKEKLLTAEEFFERYGGKDSPSYELVKGKLVEMTPPSGVHGETAIAIGSALYDFVRRSNLGRVMVETGYTLGREPDTVRGPDVSFVMAERVPQGGWARGYVEGPPDLAVEVVSPSDSAAEVEGKVHDYLSNGTRRVWVVYASTKRLLAYSLDGSVRWYQEEDTLEDQELLPGFAVPLAELFPSE